MSCPPPTHVHKGRNRRETKAKVRILIDITPFFIRKAHIWHLVPEPACELCDQARAELSLLRLYQAIVKSTNVKQKQRMLVFYAL